MFDFTKEYTMSTTKYEKGASQRSKMSEIY
jgi:hypothetical protein